MFWTCYAGCRLYIFVSYAHFNIRIIRPSYGYWFFLLTINRIGFEDLFQNASVNINGQREQSRGYFFSNFFSGFRKLLANEISEIFTNRTRDYRHLLVVGNSVGKLREIGVFSTRFTIKKKT